MLLAGFSVISLIVYKCANSNLLSSFNQFCSFYLLLTIPAVLFKMTSTNSSDDLINQMQRLIDLNDLLYSIQNDTDHTNNGPKVRLIIYHQLPGVELVSPVYSSLFATCYLSPDQCVDVGFATQVGFNIGLDQYGTVGVLMYKLQRKSVDQSNKEDIASEEEATCVQLVMIWKIDSPKGFYINSYLIEHDGGHVWDRVRLTLLAYKCELVNIQHSPIEETWLMRDHTVLMTSLNATCEEECCKLEMTISETSIKDDTMRPMYIDLNR
jgi:hypothetical protein